MKKTLETIVFFGSGPVAAASLEHVAKHFSIEYVITKQAPPHHRGSVPVRELAEKLKLPLQFANTRDELDKLLRSLKPISQVGLIVDYGVIVSKQAIKTFKYGIINSHFSLLPKWRGADPITFSILSGQTETGVSLMLIVEALDEGQLLVQETVSIAPDATTPSLTAQLIEKSNEMLVKYVPLYLASKIKPYDQPQEQAATYSRKLVKEDGAIDWNERASTIERQIRAYAGWPGSRTTLAGKEVAIVEAEVVNMTGTPGEVLTLDNKLVVCAGEGAIHIIRLKPAGGKEMPGSAFIAGHKNRL